jgi:hypothetical protein
MTKKPFDPSPVAVAVVMLVAAGLCALIFSCNCDNVRGGNQRKPTLSIALDDGPHSQMLRHELERDWRRPNPQVRLNPRQYADLMIISRSMNAIRDQVRAQFVIVYVERDAVPMPERLRLPAVRINRQRWESLNQRAFAFETRPLLTLDWYRARYVALYDRETSLDALVDGCRDEGYSGSAQVETPPPWASETDQSKF